MENIGETQRAIGVRKKEHQSAVRLADFPKSPIAEHAHSEDPVHEVEWNSMKVIDLAGKNWKMRGRWEKPYISTGANLKLAETVV